MTHNWMVKGRRSKLRLMHSVLLLDQCNVSVRVWPCAYCVRCAAATWCSAQPCVVHPCASLLLMHAAGGECTLLGVAAMPRIDAAVYKMHRSAGPHG